MRLRIFYIVSNLFLVFLSFLLVITIRGQEPLVILKQQYQGFLLLLLLYVFTGLFFDKYNFRQRYGMRKTLLPVLYSNLAFAGAASALLIIFGHLGVSRVLFFGTLAITTSLELLGTLIINSFRKLKKKDFNYEKETDDLSAATDSPAKPPDAKSHAPEPNDFNLRRLIIEETGIESYNYLKKYVPFNGTTFVLSVKNPLNIKALPPGNLHTIVNLHRVNDHRRMNLFFETVNQKLPDGGLFAGCGKTQEIRKKRFLRKYTPLAGFLLYTIDFLIHRVMPKLGPTKGLYFQCTDGNNRRMFRAEILGRLFSCGFELIDESYVNGRLFFVARKVRHPFFDNSPTYGPLIRLRRIGKDGKIIGVHKLRTMHPYAEYIQKYVIEKQGVSTKDLKIKDDFRISSWGKIFRKLWIDELPMIYNLLKGDLKIVGVRPVSEQNFNTYPEYLQEKRIKFKPGLIPPMYADMCNSQEAFYESENRYIEAYEKHPLRTDWIYFWKAFYNIVFRRARSA